MKRSPTYEILNDIHTELQNEIIKAPVQHDWQWMAGVFVFFGLFYTVYSNFTTILVFMIVLSACMIVYLQYQVINISQLDHEWQTYYGKDLPYWMKDNKFLYSGYRPELKTFQACIKSIFRIHNESGNIWSHLIGLVLFGFLAIQDYDWQSTHFCQNVGVSSPSIS